MLALIHRPANAQVLFGSMVGNVTDATDSAVPGASVKITDLSTNEVRTFSANQNGAYNAVNLPAGTYSIEITKEGFRTFAASNVLVGGAGDDTLDGAAGTDTLDGGSGTDVGLNGETLINIP